MTGDIFQIDGEWFEVVWNGEEGLVAPRRTKVQWDWEPPKRIYNRTGKHRKTVAIDNQEISINTILLEETNVGSGVAGSLAEAAR